MNEFIHLSIWKEPFIICNEKSAIYSQALQSLAALIIKEMTCISFIIPHYSYPYICHKLTPACLENVSKFCNGYIQALHYYDVTCFPQKDATSSTNAFKFKYHHAEIVPQRLHTVITQRRVNATQWRVSAIKGFLKRSYEGKQCHKVFSK